MAKKKIQSVEVSCLVHATEDGDKVKRSIMETLSIESEPEEEVLQGHFGNAITHATWHLTGEEAWTVFRKTMEAVGEDGRAQLMRGFASTSDEHGALYLRLNKQLLVKRVAAFSLSDPVRIRVKPRGFMMKGTRPEEFYEKLLRPDAR